MFKRIGFIVLAVLFVAGLFAAGPGAAPVKADSGRDTWNDNGALPTHTYQKIDTAKSWHDAQTYCAGMDAHLVTINSADENNFVQNYGQNTWLGATDEVAEGTWKWVTGETFYVAGQPPITTGYNNWLTDFSYNGVPDPQPDNGNGVLPNENYLSFAYFVGNGTWNDSQDSLQSFVCEWDYNIQKTITGTLTGLNPNNNGKSDYDGMSVRADPLNGGNDSCNGQVNSDGSFQIDNCRAESDLVVSLDKSNGYTFTKVTVPLSSFNKSVDPPVAAAPSALMPVSRSLEGIVYHPDGSAFGDFDVKYEIIDPLGIVTTGSVTTDNSSDPAKKGIFKLNGLNDASRVHLVLNKDGYDFGGDAWLNPPWRSDVTGDARWELRAKGTYWISARIETLSQNQACRAGVNARLYRGSIDPAHLVAATDYITGSEGTIGFWKLEPASDYIVVPSKTGCVFVPSSITVDISNGGTTQDVVFQVPNTGIYGNVKPKNMGDPTLQDYASLAYYLVATYTTPDGIAYTNSVNWVDGSFWIPVPPNSGGTLTISRVGGAAAFGYQSSTLNASGTPPTVVCIGCYAISPITITQSWIHQDVILNPDRNVTGTIAGQFNVPILKNTWVDFGEWVSWKQTATGSAYTVKAQPKIYYFSPIDSQNQPGILGSTPTRTLVNLTSAASQANVNFTVNLRNFQVDGCINNNRDGRDQLVLTNSSLRFRPATGTTLFPVNVVNDGCGPGNDYFSVIQPAPSTATGLPKGIVGSFESADGAHTLNGPLTIDGLNDNWNTGLSAWGDRSITGRVYMGNPKGLGQFVDRGFNDLFILRDAATNQRVNLQGVLQASKEFVFPTLERKAYTLTWNPDVYSQGYTVNPFPMSPIVQANLTSGDFDIPGIFGTANSGFWLVHTPIDPTSATGNGYFAVANDGTDVNLNWGSAWVPWNDNVQSYEVQVGSSTTAFTDTLPSPFSVQPKDWSKPSVTLTGMNNGSYRWRVRAVFEYDKGPWLDTSPIPSSPQGAFNPGTAIGPVSFNWDNSISNTVSGAKYVVQYSDNPTFPATTATVSLPAVQDSTRSTLVNPAIGKTYYWRVKAQNSSGVDISGWSPIQMFFNRYPAIPLSGLSITSADKGWNPNPVTFNVPSASIPAVLPPNTYLQYQFPMFDNGAGHNYLYNNLGDPDQDNVRDWNSITIPVTAANNTTTIYPYDLKDGRYEHWRVRLVSGNDWRATPVTGWTEVTTAPFSKP